MSLARRIAPALAALLALAAAAPAQELTPASLAAWRARIEPAEQELEWTAIPWRATFWEAVSEGQEAERPILLWAMNGHPLGCV